METHQATKAENQDYRFMKDCETKIILFLSLWEDTMAVVMAVASTTIENMYQAPTTYWNPPPSSNRCSCTIN